MRLRACLPIMLPIILLATGGCAQFPERLRVEIGDQAVEIEGRCPKPILPAYDEPFR